MRQPLFASIQVFAREAFGALASAIDLRSAPVVASILVVGLSASSIACSSSSGDASAPTDGATNDATSADARGDTSTQGVDSTPSDDATSTDGGADASNDAVPTDTGADDPGPPPTSKCTVNADADGFFTLTSPKSDYVARLPAGYDVGNPKPTRLLVALHGCGDTAYNHATWAAVPYALRDTQDYIAISVGGRDGSCWTVPADEAIVSAAITHVRSCFYVHQKKLVLAGYSSGGDLTYVMSMKNAASFAGILIEHSDLSQNVGAKNVDATLAAAAWKLNVSIRAGDNDAVYPIAEVKSDFQKMLDAGFPAKLVETADTHDGTSDDWAALIPQSANWRSP